MAVRDDFLEVRVRGSFFYDQRTGKHTETSRRGGLIQPCMILSQPEIRAEVEKGQIRFDPPLEERQWHMHQTAPWLQPGWNGQITLEIRNSGPFLIELTPTEDMPCQVTFFQLTSELAETIAYGARPTDVFQGQASPLPPAIDQHL